MGGKQFRIGSVAVLFAVVMLCVSIFAALTAATAAVDRRTAQRYGEYVQELGQCEDEGTRWLARADAYIKGRGELPPNTHEDEKGLSTTVESGRMYLTIRLAVEGEEYEIVEWSCRSRWQAEEEQWSLWQAENKG